MCDELENYRQKKILKLCHEAQELCRPSELAAQPLMPYDAWCALGPGKAAEYLAKRRGYTAEKRDKLRAILETFWEPEPNEKGQP